MFILTFTLRKNPREASHRIASPTHIRDIMSHSGADECKKWASLATVVAQNTALYLTAHASLAAPGQLHYIPSVAVLSTELIKAAVSVVCAASEVGICGLVKHLRESFMRDTCWTFAFAVPAACYSIHNNLWYVAVESLSPVTIAVLMQLKIVFVAFFSRVMLGQRLGAARCMALALLFVGLSLLEGARAWPAPAAGATAAAAAAAADLSLGLDGEGVGGNGSGNGFSVAFQHLVRRLRRASSQRLGPPAMGAPLSTSLRTDSELRGALAMVGVCVLSGFAGVLTERLLKDQRRTASLWVRNVQMALFSLPFAALAVLVADGAAVRARGPFAAFNRWLVATILLGALGGLAVSFVFRYADNILKAFAVGLSIALNGMLSFALFGVRLSACSLVGVALVAVASIAYNVAPRGGGRGDGRSDGGGEGGGEGGSRGGSGGGGGGGAAQADDAESDEHFRLLPASTALDDEGASDACRDGGAPPSRARAQGSGRDENDDDTHDDDDDEEEEDLDPPAKKVIYSLWTYERVLS